MPDLLNNTFKTELLEGFMHQMDSEETENKIKPPFCMNGGGHADFAAW